MIFGTKIKWYSHLNKNAPTIDNVWGSLVKVLDACLVDGFSEQQSTNFIIQGNFLTLTYPTPHLYQQYQVLSVTGANSTVLNGIHRIVEVSADGLSLVIEYQSLEGVVENSLMITTKLPPLGWEKVFASTNKAVYKLIKESGQANYLFVDDSFPEAPYVTTWAKYARIGIAEDYAGDFQPKGATIPADWSEFPAKVSGSNVILGTSKWFYATNNPIQTGAHTITSAPANGVREWQLVGETNYFYLNNATITASPWCGCLHVGEYDCIHQGFFSNIILSATTFTNQLQNQTMASNFFNRHFTTDFTFYILKNTINDTASLAAPSSFPGISKTGASNVLSTAGPVNHFRTMIVSDNILMGAFKNMHWLALSQPYRHLQKIQQGSDIFMAFTQYASNTVVQTVLKIGSKD